MKTIFALFVLCISAFAQSGGGPKPTQLTVTLQTRPQAVPTSLTDVITQSCYVCYADITANGQTILIQDRQSTPVPWINAILGTSGTVTTWWFIANDDARCRWFPNGLSWQAGSSGVTGYLTIKCQTGPCTLNSGF